MAKHILYLIYRFVKLAIDSGHCLVVDVPIPLLRIVQGENISSAGRESDGYGGLFDDDLDDGEVGRVETSFTQAHADFLAKELPRIALPNIHELDQVTILALSDTILKIERQRSSLDENGARYFLALSMYTFYYRSEIPAASSSRLIAEGLGSRDIAWAFYSDSQDTLLNMCNQELTNNRMTWKTARDLGLGFWIKSPDVMVMFHIFII